MIEKATFPIQGIIVQHEEESRKEIRRNETVKCLFCQGKFLINEDNAFIRCERPDTVIVQCPRCERKAEAYYYFDRVERRRRA